MMELITEVREEEGVVLEGEDIDRSKLFMTAEEEECVCVLAEDDLLCCV